MNLRFTLADKISITVILIGILSLALVFYISNSYKHLAYKHHSAAIQSLANLEVKDLLDDLKKNSLDLALSIEHENDFKRDYRYKRYDNLTEQLNNQFHQYFVTAGVIKLLKLYILDTEFTLTSVSTEGMKTDPDAGIICPTLSHQALSRHGSEKLQTLSQSCLYRNYPVFAVIVPFGGLNPTGYIQVITDLAYNLRKIEQALGMPIQITSVTGESLYQSDGWQLADHNINYISVDIPIIDDRGNTIMYISLKPDMTNFNTEVSKHRDWVIALAFATTAITIFIVLFILQRSTIPPLAKIHDVLERLQLHSKAGNEDSRVLFEQLLEQIIQVRKKSGTNFSVMILDLTRFKQVNDDYGKHVGDKLLLEVEQRLCSILRESDLISWVGTDSPGHKLLPSDTKTQYRATIARLGGDEFGLLLPSAQNPEQARTVAQRIVDTLNQPFTILDNHIEIQCKIGISIYPQHGEDEKLLIRNADKAMYQAKSNHSTVAVFEGSTSSNAA